MYWAVIPLIPKIPRIQVQTIHRKEAKHTVVNNTVEPTNNSSHFAVNNIPLCTIYHQGY